MHDLSMQIILKISTNNVGEPETLHLKRAKSSLSTLYVVSAFYIDSKHGVLRAVAISEATWSYVQHLLLRLRIRT